MKLPRRQFLRLAAGAVPLPALSRIAAAQTYPTRPVHLVAAYPPGGGSMAVRASRPDLRHREPAGRRHQYRHRGGGECAAGRAYAWCPTPSMQRSTKSSVSTSSATSPRLSASFAQRMSSRCIRPFQRRRSLSSSPMRGPIMATNGIGSGSHMPGELFKMMTATDLVQRSKVRIISGGLIEFVRPRVDHWVLIEVVHCSHDAILEFLLSILHTVTSLARQPCPSAGPCSCA
jgi:hypothetical protein